MSAPGAGPPGTPADALTVAVLAGGPSAEHEVSLASARSVSAGLASAGHRVLWVEIARGGEWSHEGRRLSLCPSGGLLEADLAFPVLHGRFGEDGTVQGLLETLGIPYVGSGVSASALCMNKVLFKDVMAAHGLPQVRYRAIAESYYQADPARALAPLIQLGLPVFVKPVHEGSSLGIEKVGEAPQLRHAVERAFAHDALVIVEAMAPGIEVECAVLGSSQAQDGADLLASEPGEITYVGDWYDYAAKYTPGGMELVIPARITGAARARVRELALETFMLAGCEGLARVDFFVEGDTVLVNELNTMPGFTETSVYAKLLAAGAVDYPEVLDRLCRIALASSAPGRQGVIGIA